MGVARGDLLDVVGDEDLRRRVVVPGEVRQPGDELFPTAQVEAAPGSSSSSSSGSGISARAICTRLRSPSLRVPNVRFATARRPIGP